MISYTIDGMSAVVPEPPTYSGGHMMTLASFKKHNHRVVLDLGHTQVVGHMGPFDDETITLVYDDGEMETFFKHSVTSFRRDD
jgi:hypothetical protein